VLARRLARSLSTIADDLVNPYDESTDEFTPFSAPLGSAAAMDETALRKALGVADRYRLDKRELDPHAFDEWGEPYVSSYATLYKVMTSVFTDIHVIWARAPGVVRVRTWFVGRFGKDWLVGLRTESTET
jgi:hypothetical protein